MILCSMEKLKEFFKENWILLFSFIYIISPIDLIPGDLASGIGLIDDMAVLLSTSIFLFVKFLLRKKEEVPKK
mgnify:CR=1 FL=1